MTVASGKWDVKRKGSWRRERLLVRQRHESCRTSAPLAPTLESYLPAAVLAHLASVFRKGYAFVGASIVPVSAVLKGTMRP